ncbi:MAG: TM2 domain-containing protein [Alphaproteobacteria bacterium]|nr:TM2 domain-containing protein [Alphaproteobacteria bacterium]
MADVVNRAGAAPPRVPAANEHYCPGCGQVIANAAPICPICGSAAAMVSGKSRLAALLLNFFLGVFGVHRFYVGKIGTGLLQLFTLGGFGIWALVDFILIAVGEFTDREGRKVLIWFPNG